MLPVVLYHANVGAFSGGFVGVDIFYVISGYLITSLILKDITRGTFSFVSFYERRIRRIFPALFGMVFFCAFAAAVLLVPKDFATFGKSMVAMTFFVSNIFFKRTTGIDGYFGRTSDSEALLHTWSLSVEEQFYLFFPIMLLLFVRWNKARLAKLVFLVAAASFAISIWAIQYKPLSAFYIFIPRAWELLIGSLLATKAVRPLSRRLSREIASFAGMSLIAWAVLRFTKDTTFPGLSAMLPCIGAWLIIYAGENGPSYIKSTLSWRPLTLIGVISYSLYLWHWPLIVFSRYFSGGDLSKAATYVIIAVSIVLAFLSFEFIEKPFRGANSTINRQHVFSLAVSVSALSAAVGFLVAMHGGFPSRYNNVTRQLVLRNVERKDDYQEVCGNWKKEVKSLVDIHFCQLGPASFLKVMFWGDSHVQQLYPLIRKMYNNGEFQDHGVLLAIANGCPPTEHLNSIGRGYHCDSFANLAMRRAEEDDVDTVFIGFNTWWAVHQDVCPSVQGRCTGTLSLQEVRARFLQELSNHILRLEAGGKRVIVSLPFPMFDKSIPDLEIRNAIFGSFGLAGTAKDITSFEFRKQIASVARSTGAEVFDPRESLCAGQYCITQVGGVSIYKDDNHIAASQIGILEGNFKQVLQHVNAARLTTRGPSGISN